MFGESSAIYPRVVIHLFVPTMLRWNIRFRKLSEFQPVPPPKKSQRAFLRAKEHEYLKGFCVHPMNFQRWKKKKRLNIAYSIIRIDTLAQLPVSIERSLRPVARYDNIYGTLTFERMPRKYLPPSIEIIAMYFLCVPIYRWTTLWKIANRAFSSTLNRMLDERVVAISRSRLPRPTFAIGSRRRYDWYPRVRR